MTPSHPPDPLLERLRRLPRVAPDDVATARTLAAAEAAFATTRCQSRRRARYGDRAPDALGDADGARGVGRALHLGRGRRARPPLP